MSNKVAKSGILVVKEIWLNKSEPVLFHHLLYNYGSSEDLMILFLNLKCQDGLCGSFHWEAGAN